MKLRIGALRRPLTILVAGIAVGSLLVGSAIAITSSSFKYSSAKTGYLALSPMDFASDSLFLGGPANDYFNGWGGSNLSNDDPGRCFNAGVNLPQGAKIKSIKYFYTSDATGELYATLVRVKPGNGNTQRLAEVSPADDSDTRTSVTVSVPSSKQTVDNKTFQYGLGVCPFDGTVFHGARIKYTYKNAGA